MTNNQVINWRERFNRNMRFYFLINLLFTVTLIFASGNIEIPENYMDISPLDLTKNRQNDTIYLPYIKPAGIDKIITSSVKGLIIDKIIVDGRIVRPQRIYFDMGAYEATSYLYEQNVNSEEEQFLMPMSWRANYYYEKTYDENLSEGVYFNYYSRNGIIKYSPDKYFIPYGSKEVFITYRIRFSDYSEDNKFKKYIISDESYTVKFNVIWPEIRISDKTGRIMPPDNYQNLGIYEFNSDGKLEIGLPFESPNIQGFIPYIDNRWLIIYELIGDGKKINKKNLTNNEINNLEKIITVGTIDINSKMVKILLQLYDGGIILYKNTKEPPVKYIIPINCKEIYLTYDILFKDPNSIGTYSNYNRRICVKWEIKW